MTYILALLLAPWLALAALAPITITGRVVNESNAPLEGALVTSTAASGATTTDADGQFTLILDIDPVPPSVRILVSGPGYVEVEATVPIANGTGSVEAVLQRSPSIQESVTVSGRVDDVPSAPPTRVLEPITVTRVAGAGDNIYRVLQALPGVAAADDFGSRLAVRGGGPDQNLTVMDNVEIHNPYRLFGLTSAFNPDTIDRFELTAGGFSAKWGDRLSSILLVDNREGRRAAGINGSAALSATDTNLVLEGGMPKGSWLVSARRTYYDVIAERVTDNDLPSFNDVQAKGVWEPRPGHRVTLFGLASRESTDATFNDDTNGDRIGLLNKSRNDVASLNYATTIGRRTSANTTVASYQYRDALDVDGLVQNESTRSNSPDADNAFAAAAVVFTRDLAVRDYSVRQNFKVALTPKQTFEFGFDAHALRTEWGWTITGDRNDSEANGSSVIGGAGLPSNLRSAANNARAGAFFEDEFQPIPALRLVGGVRLDWSRLSGETIASPRARATIDLSARTRLKFAGGLFTQSPGYEKLIQSDYFVDLSDGRGPKLQSERSIHTIGGFEHTFSEALTARVEAYHKTFDRMLAGRLETPAETAARVAQYDFPAALASSIPTSPQVTTFAENSGGGQSYGVEMYVEKKQMRSRDFLNGWLSYTWGKATLDNYGQSYAFDYDRRHALSLVSTWRFIPRIDLGATLRVASGFPASTPVGLRVASVLKEGATQGAPGSLIPRRDSNGLLMWTPDYGTIADLNRGQLPLYARLDLRFTYIKSPASRWQFYLEAINALNRNNAGSLTPSLKYNDASDQPTLTLSRDGGLPFFPSGGFRIRF